MPVTITISNTVGEGDTRYAAVIEKVSVTGTPLSPRILWSVDAADFLEYDDITPFTDTYVFLLEDDDIPGKYEVTVSGIDGTAENLCMTIIDNENDKSIGVGYSLPGALVIPAVTLEFNAEENRT